MSNKLKKFIKCCLCDREVERTDDCHVIFGRDVCPACSDRVVRLANKWTKEHDQTPAKED